jgi:hypothetical protein
LNPIALQKGEYTILIMEQHVEGLDQFSLWHGLPNEGELVGTWLIANQTPPGVADAVDEVIETHKVLRVLREAVPVE